MNEPENFLTRWSRRKLDADDEPAASTPEPVAPAPAVAPPTLDGGAADPAVTPPPAFDLASLPSLDSITAATDVRPFLMPGVPAELSRAALRRAWTADPAIRDFVGLAENAWDFTKPNEIAGFGDLPAGLDIKKMVAEVFGEARKEATVAPQQRPVVGEPAQVDAIVEQSAPQVVAAVDPDRRSEPNPSSALADAVQPDAGFVHRDNNTATQQSNSAAQQDRPIVGRSHGGALPR